jgi:predicted dehydrogenase
MTASVRVGLIGGGDHARHALTDAIGSMAGWSIAAVADPSADARQRISALLPQAQLYDNLETLLSATRDLDLIIVATPPAASVSVVQSAWATKAAILMEKPAALRASDLDQLPANREAPVTCAYGYRFHPTVTAFRRRLEELRSLESIELRFNAPIEVTGTWRATRAAGGGALRDLGAHLLDLSSCLLTAPLVLKQATIRSTRTDDDDATLDYQAGTVRLRISCAYHGTPEFSLRATGTGGLLRADLWSMTTPANGLVEAIVSRLRSKTPGGLRPANALRRSRMAMLSAAIAPSPSLSPSGAASIRNASLVLRHIEAAEAASR